VTKLAPMMVGEAVAESAPNEGSIFPLEIELETVDKQEDMTSSPLLLRRVARHLR